MIELPPRFGSKRFREIVVPAIKGDPASALAGLYFMATRRRVRGWSRLMLAASRAPLNYLRWTRHGEVRAFTEFRKIHPRRHDAAPIVVLLLFDKDSGADTTDLTVASLKQALGDPMIYSPAASVNGLTPLPQRDSLAETVSALADLHPRSWLLPICSGDRVSASLGDVLARSDETGDKSLIYWDEDYFEGGQRSDPWIKPDWDPILFGSLGGLLGACVMSLDYGKSLVKSSPHEAVGAQGVRGLLFDMAQTWRPKHVPLILTHRAEGLGCSSPSMEMRPSPASWPSVSIIIPTRDRPELLAACLEGVDETDYPGALEVIVVDNASRDPAAIELLEQARKASRILTLRDEGDFNFSRLNNLAVEVARGELLCLLNNDVEPLDKDWLRALVRYAMEDGVGAVGPQLLYPSGRIQHAGVVIGLGGAAGHVQKGVEPSARTFRTWHAATREASALTAAVMVLKKSVFLEVGGFDETFAVSFNDVDLCLRLRDKGLRNIYVAEARLLHRESESRGQDRSPVKAQRFAGELGQLQARWGTERYRDPYFSPLFSRLVEPCVLAP